MIKKITDFIRSFRRTESQGEAIDLTYGKLKVRSTIFFLRGLFLYLHHNQ